MPKPPRKQILCDDSYFHVAWRCHNKDWLIAKNSNKRCYYDLLFKYKDRYGLTFHSYHLMDNHLHLVGKLESVTTFSNFFRVVNNLYSRYINRRLKRVGQIVMDRFVSPKINDDHHLLSVMVYNDLNGVRAGKDKIPEDSEWSSYKFYAYGKGNDLISPPPSYLALGDYPKVRQTEYRSIVRAMAKINQKAIFQQVSPIAPPLIAP